MVAWRGHRVLREPHEGANTRASMTVANRVAHDVSVTLRHRCPSGVKRSGWNSTSLVVAELHARQPALGVMRSWCVRHCAQFPVTAATNATPRMSRKGIIYE